MPAYAHTAQTKIPRVGLAVKKIKEDNGNGDQSNESEPSISENENTNQKKDSTTKINHGPS